VAEDSKHLLTAVTEHLLGWRVGWLALHRAPPPVLFHYTNANGLIGLVESGVFWASDARFLNDSTELTYTSDVLHSVLDGLEAEFAGTSAHLLIDICRTNLFARTDFECYVGCFCDEGDLLSQWRGYGETTASYAVGFDSARLSEREELSLRKVVYDRGDQERLLRGAIQPVCGMVNRLTEPQAAGAVDDVVHELNKMMVGCWFSFKHSAFAEEHEWRLVHVPALRRERFGQTLFRSGPHGLLPYLEIPLADPEEVLPVREVRVGPSHHPDVALMSVERFLRRQQILARTSTTTVPLRF
jgi:hypothetical protein